VDSDIYKYIFPKTRLNPESTSKEFWRTTTKGSYKAVGRGSGLTGHSGKILLADDLIADRAEANSETVRESAWSWWTSVFYTRKQSKSGFVLINTRWSLDDVQGKVERQEKENRSRFGPNGLYDRWEKISFPAIPDEDIVVNGNLLCKAGQSICPERFTLEDLTKTKNSYIATGKVGDWASLYMQNPIIAENAKFQRGWFRYYQPDNIIGKQLYYTTLVDLAISQKKSADYTVVRTIAKEVDGPNWYLMEVTRGRLDPLQTIDAIFYHYNLYRSKVYIESVAYQAALAYFVVEEQRKRNIFFTIEEIKPSRLSKKEERIEGLIPLYKAGVIHHRKGQDENLEMELMQFPFGSHDDECDAVAMGLQVVRHAPREQGIEKQEGRFNWKRKKVATEAFDPSMPFDKV
jgi:predicted phage terminase large subunit-like protein